MRRTLAVMGSLVLLTACGESTGVRGSTDQWLKGRSLAVNVVFTNMGPLIKVRNDSTREMSIVPTRVTGWFKTAGKVAGASVFGVFDKDASLVSGEFGVTAADGSTRTARCDAEHPDLRLRPGEWVVLSPGLWSFKTGPFDGMKQLRVAIGKDGTAEQEVFTIR
jgi:hypothetical protein